MRRGVERGGGDSNSFSFLTVTGRLPLIVILRKINYPANFHIF